MEETVAHLGHATLHLLDGETHMAPVERGRAVAAAVAAFLSA